MHGRDVEPLTGPFEVGEFRVDPGLNRLERAGQAIPLEPRAMDLLRCLARRWGETVSKESLLEEVWGGAFVVEGVIAKTMSGLRAALGDDAEAPTYILTVPRRGYRLLAEVRPVAPAAPREPEVAPPSPGPSESAAGGVGPGERRVAAPGANRLLVLLTVVAVAVALWAALRSPARERPARGGEPPAVVALPDSVQKLMLEARLLWSSRGMDAVRRANELFAEAVKEAPASAEARGWLALSFVTRGNYLGEVETAFERAAEEARRALELDERSAIAHCAAGALAINRDLDATKALGHLDRAWELDPALLVAGQYRAEALSILGRNDEALTAIAAAIRAEPTSAVFQSVRGLILLRADRPLAALEAFDRALVLEPRFGWVHRDRAWALLRLGREREATEAFYLEAKSTGEAPEHLDSLRAAIDAEGVAGFWRWRLARLEAVRATGLRLRPMQYAEALAGVGRLEEALAALETAAAARDGEYFFYFRDSSAFAPLRDDPRFAALYRGRRGDPGFAGASSAP